MNICVCEHHPEQLVYIKELIRKQTFSEGCQIIGFTSPTALLEFANEQHIHIIIMDVNLSEGNSIEIINILHQKQPNTQVIFVSGHSSTRSLVYEAKHMFYLDKPINEQWLVKALHKAIEKVKEIRIKQPVQFIVLNKDVQVIVKFSDIIFIESQLRKLHIYTVKDGMIETYASIKEVLDKLDERFLQSHKSFIVNMDFIKKCVKRRQFVLEHTDKSIPISQSRAAEAFGAFMDYISKKAIYL